MRTILPIVETKRLQIKDKSGLARLMAIENLSVNHDTKAKTASFDVKNRVLTLPVLEDMSNFTYDAFIAHEIGHALYTPYSEELYEEIFSEIPQVFLNITEDARIEKLVKKKYPGTVRDFYYFYKKYSSQPNDFFGLSDKPIASRSLIDRINLHFKIGSFHKVDFSPEENKFVKMVESEITFEDAVAAAKAIYEYMKNQGYIREIDEEDLKKDGEEGEGNSQQDGETIVESKRHKKVQQDKIVDLNGAGETQDNFSENIAKTFQGNKPNNSDVVFGDIMKIKDYKKYITELKPKVYNSLSVENKESYLDFIRSITPTVNMMVSQFNLRKSARDYHRNTNSKSGELNMDKISGYKFTDDIFLKNEVIYDSKSHGIVMMLDWSSSMQVNIEHTIKQLIVLAEFSRKVGIPLEVYCYTTKCHHSFDINYVQDYITPGQIMSDMNVNLIKLFSASDSSEIFKRKSALIFSAAKASVVGAEIGSMGGTPISSVAFISEYILNDFKAKYKREKIIFVMLSDGHSTDNLYSGNTILSTGRKIIMRDTATGINYTYNGHANDGEFYHTVFKYIKEKCNVTTMIGFFLTNRLTFDTINLISPKDRNKINMNDIDKVFNSQKYYQFDSGIAFDSFYAVSIKNFNVDMNSGDLNISSYSSEKAKKDRVGCYLSRSTKPLIFMNKFIKEIS